MVKKTNAQIPTVRRPAVVTVLGHVDHGKTTLLDTIRKAKVAAGESGGITQHIGAYQVQLDPKDPASKITFIDTPGHEAFSKMRSRGAKVADIAILVVAANDGVKPQTKEAIAHIKKAGIPYIVAINKIDVDGVNLDMVKSQLAENGVIVEDYGGDVVALEISALKNKGIDQLLEMIHLIYEMEEEKVTTDTQAIILESFVDPQKGVVANILLRYGEINTGDIVYCEGIEAKVKLLITDSGKFISKAVASQPIQLLGFKEILPVGAVISSDKQKSISVPEEKLSKTPEQIALEAEGGETHLKIILKTDVSGTLEALKAQLPGKVDVIDSGIGNITDSDVLLARSTHSRLVGFNVSAPKDVKKLAEMEEVTIQTFDVIYHLLEDLAERVAKLALPSVNEEELGRAEVIAEFNIKGSHIAGCNVVDGKIIRSERIKVLRGEVFIAQTKIAAMQVERKDVKEAKKKQEVALVFRPDVKFQMGDIVISYQIVD